MCFTVYEQMYSLTHTCLTAPDIWAADVLNKVAKDVEPAVGGCAALEKKIPGGTVTVTTETRLS